MNTLHKAIFAVSMLVFAVFLSDVSAAPSGTKSRDTDEAVTTSAKVVSGKVTAIGKDYIAVAYEEDLQNGVEQEIFLPIDTSVKLVHKSKITDINPGDRVELSYDEEVKTYQDGKSDKARKATKVSFISPAKKSPFSDESDAEGGLDLKGLRGE